jgi:hypothetical protein
MGTQDAWGSIDGFARASMVIPINTNPVITIIKSLMMKTSFVECSAIASIEDDPDP